MNTSHPSRLLPALLALLVLGGCGGGGYGAEVGYVEPPIVDAPC